MIYALNGGEMFLRFGTAKAFLSNASSTPLSADLRCEQEIILLIHRRTQGFDTIHCTFSGSSMVTVPQVE